MAEAHYTLSTFSPKQFPVYVDKIHTNVKFEPTPEPTLYYLYYYLYILLLKYSKIHHYNNY